MAQQQPSTIYQQQTQKLGIELQALQARRSRLGWIRLIVFLITAAVCYKTFVAAGLWGILPLVAGIGILLYLVSLDVNNNAKIANVKTLIGINEEELQVLQNSYQNRYDGTSFSPALHPYANDLDLFGTASLYQWMNRCYTEQGRAELAANLLEPLTKDPVIQRHEAVKEIAMEVEWRQQVQAYAMQTPITIATQRKAEAWMQEEESHFIAPAWKVVVLVYSILAIGTLVATILGYISATAFSAFYLLFFISSIILSRNTVKPYVQLSGIVKEVSTLHLLVQWLETKSFTAPLLKNWQQSTAPGKGKASHEIRQLKVILDRFDLRLSIVGLLFFNPFLLWDVRQMIALNDWRRKNKTLLPKWFAWIGEAEVMHTLATLHFNYPGWTFPNFSDQHFTLRGIRIGHPLIPQSVRVTNDFDMEGVAKIALVTGSNMAGKSTFLRSLGVNIILAQLGAPVCASAFTLSPVHLMSSMRIADNLAENTSTFYAELKKLKTIIEAVNQHEKIFILLDEILRGTNSLDRHTGSEALMKQLIHHDAVAVIATHDVELASLESTFPSSIENYHFDVQVEAEELYFDYKLKPGICTSLNASILMKKIGIEL